jgi:large subunit ribosomal protein L18e
MKKLGKITAENTVLVAAIRKLNGNENAIWRRIAYELSKPRRKRVEVNISKIARFVKDGDTIVVPGKVLGSGMLDKKVTIAAFSFSQSAKMLIGKAGGKAATIDEIMHSNPTGKGVLLLK